ncbi:MAG: PAS domain S-box protein [Haloarculaceae archaeon]
MTDCSAGETGGSAAVLFVDDAPDYLPRVEAALADAEREWTVRSVESGAAALSTLAEEAVDCVVADYALPDTDGLALFDRVRERAAALPVLLYTDAGDEAVAAEAVSRGVTDYLRRDGEDAVARLTECLERVVTDRDAERRRREREERFRRLLAGSIDIITVIDEFGVVRYVSPAAERLLGYEPDELVGERVFEYVHPEDRERMLETFFDAVENPDQLPVAEYRFRAADGSWRWLESRGSDRIDQPDLQGFVVNARDISDRKQVEQRYRALVEHSPTTTTVLQVDGTITYASPSHEAVLGHEPDALVGENAVEFIHPTDRERIRERFDAMLDGDGDGQPVEFRFRAGDGEWRWIEARSRNHLDEPAVEGIVVNAMDVTERKRQERQLRQQNERLAEFASVVSHDLRNPLHVASGQLELGMETGRDEHLERARSSLSRMDDLIEDLLTLARQGQVVRDTEPVALSRVVADAWATVDVDGQLADAVGDATVIADRARLRRALENLFRNAAEHAGAGVTVTVGRLDEGFFVADDGPGIPAAERENVFDHGYTTGDDGTGLGLSIVQSIVAAHDWEIAVTDATPDESGSDSPSEASERTARDRRSRPGARFEITGVTFAPANE